MKSWRGNEACMVSVSYLSWACHCLATMPAVVSDCVTWIDRSFGGGKILPILDRSHTFVGFVSERYVVLIYNERKIYQCSTSISQKIWWGCQDDAFLVIMGWITLCFWTFDIVPWALQIGSDFRHQKTRCALSCTPPDAAGGLGLRS